MDTGQGGNFQQDKVSLENFNNQEKGKNIKN